MAFNRFQPVQENSEDNEDEVNFTDIYDILQSSGGDEGHIRGMLHTL